MLYSDVSRVKKGHTGRVVVIGAGAIGLYVANLLAARGRDVLVVESGGWHLGGFNAGSYLTVGRPHDGIRLARARCLGGTTQLWGGQLVEFQPSDFMARNWVSQPEWRVRYDEIAPYYHLTYKALNLPPRVYRSDDSVWQGISCGRPELGATFEVFLARWLGTPNFAVMFDNEIRTSTRLSVLTGYTATAFRGGGGRVRSVGLVDNRRGLHWIEGDTFVLAAGTIENSRLLLHAAQDPAWVAPWANNGNIGRYFQDHLGGRIGAFEPADKRRFLNAFSNIVYAGHNFQPKIRLCDDALMAEEVFSTQGIFAFETEASEHLVYLKQFLRAAFYRRRLSGIGDLLRSGIGSARYLPPLMWQYMWNHRIFIPGSTKIFLCAQAEHESRADSRISIDNTSVDTYGLPRVVLDWRIGGRELSSLREFAIRIRAALRSSGFGELTIDADLLSLNRRFLTKLGDTYHQCGGTIMGTSERDGVVDKNLCVFGTENFYVAGASVFPTASSANTTLTALTFATRLVDQLTGGQASGCASHPSPVGV